MGEKWDFYGDLKLRNGLFNLGGVFLSVIEMNGNIYIENCGKCIQNRNNWRLPNFPRNRILFLICLTIDGFLIKIRMWKCFFKEKRRFNL